MSNASLYTDYPWLTPGAPLIASAPMLRIAMAKLTIAVSQSGGFGFLAGGFDIKNLSKDLAEAADLFRSLDLPLHNNVLPIGVGFLNWGCDLQLALDALAQNPVAAVWFFAPKQLSDLLTWTNEIRSATNGATKIWIQVGTVAEALEVAKTSKPDVLIVQGADAGGHGLAQHASIISLLPEVRDILAAEGLAHIPLIAAGGIVDGRGVAAALALGADGVALGTRFLACDEAVIAKGYQDEILRVRDGGVSTVATRVYDAVRGIQGWPETYRGRGVANRSYLDMMQGMGNAENEALYREAMKLGDSGWGPEGRMTTYAGTAVGLVREVKSARDIVAELQRDATVVLAGSLKRFGK